MNVTVTLPLPAKELRPNGRPHFMARARAKKAARQVAYFAALSALRDVMEIEYDGGPIAFIPSRYLLRWHYWGNVPDEDNCLASCKAYLDGCADAFNINDKSLSCSGIERIHDKDKRIILIFSDEKSRSEKPE